METDYGKDRIYREQVWSLYRQIPIGIIATLVNSCILCFVLRNAVPQLTLIIWFSVVILAVLLRYPLLYKLWQSSASPDQPSRWYSWFIANISLSGICWGSAAVFLYPADSIALQVFIAFILGGMIAGSAGTFSIRMGGFLAFSLPAGIPIITRFFLFGDEIHIFMGVMVLLFTVLMFFSAKRINIVITSSLKLKFENKDLVVFLTSEKELAEKLNEKLNKKITQHEQAESALRESEEKYRNLVERADDGILIIQDTLIKLANPSFARISGYTHEEIADRPFMKYCHPDEVERLTGMYQRRMTGDALPRVYESAFVHKDGYRVDIEISGGLINYNGKPADLVFIRDIRERKKVEEEKRELETRLQRAKKMEAIGQLAGGVAHDLNNVLTGLVGYPELMLLDIEENNPLRESILIMKSSAQKASAIVQDLLTLARRGVAVTEVVNLNDIVNDYLVSVEHEKLKSYYPNIQFEIDLQGKLLNILGSPIHLSKALMNLVSNAAEAVTGVGKVIISTRNRYVDKTIEGYDRVVEGDYVILSIVDNGIGISAGDLDKIFEPFYTKKVMGRSGTGLGMPVVWGTVKDHKGYIDIKTVERKGTTFSLYIPITRKEAAEEKSGESIEEYMGKGETILVVDDVLEQREIASALLTRLGYSVDEVSSGEEAVAYLKSNPKTLIILDMIMDPGIDGLDTYRKILEYNPRQKAIIVSGFSETERIKEAQRLGAGAYVKKPYLLETIGMAVRRELDK